MANYTLSPSPFQKFFLADGVTPAANGRVYTYLAGLTTPATTYTNAAGTVPNGNPIHLDGGGQCSIFLAPGSYSYAVYAAPLIAGMDQSGGLIETQDNISAVPSGASSLTVPGIAGETLTDGQLCYLSDGSGGATAGRWYKAGAGNAYSSTYPELGFNLGGATAGTAGVFLLAGQVTTGISVVAGSFYYPSGATAGAISATATGSARVVGFADSGTSLIAFPNPPVPNSPPELCDFRLTLTSGTAVTTADVTGAASIFLTPFRGNRISLYNGTSWIPRTSAELTLALGTLTSGLPYDVFAFDNAGTVALDPPVAWTNDLTRVTSLVLQDGVLVKTGALTRRYLGTFVTTSTTTTEDSAAKRLLWNYYNRVPRSMQAAIEGTDTWNYSTATWRQANANTANQLEAVIGVAEVSAFVQVVGNVTSSGAGSYGVSIGFDSTTVPIAGTLMGQSSAATSGVVNVHANVRHYPTVGHHKWMWLEIGSGNVTQTWIGDNGGTVFQSGILGELSA